MSNSLNFPSDINTQDYPPYHPRNPLAYSSRFNLVENFFPMKKGEGYFTFKWEKYLREENLYTDSGLNSVTMGELKITDPPKFNYIIITTFIYWCRIYIYQNYKDTDMEYVLFPSLIIPPNVDVNTIINFFAGIEVDPEMLMQINETLKENYTPNEYLTVNSFGIKLHNIMNAVEAYIAPYTIKNINDDCYPDPFEETEFQQLRINGKVGFPKDLIEGKTERYISYEWRTVDVTLINNVPKYDTFPTILDSYFSLINSLQWQTKKDSRKTENKDSYRWFSDKRIQDIIAEFSITNDN